MYFPLPFIQWLSQKLSFYRAGFSSQSKKKNSKEETFSFKIEDSTTSKDLPSIIMVSLVMAIAVSGFLGHALHKPFLLTYFNGFGPKLALPSAVAFFLLGLIFFKDLAHATKGLISQKVCILIIGGIGFYNLFHFYMLAHFNWIGPLVHRFPQISMAFLTSIELSVIATGLFLNYQFPNKTWTSNALNLIGFWLIETSIFSLFGYFFKLPVLFSYVQSFPANIAFSATGFFLLKSTSAEPSLISPLRSNLKNIRHLALLSFVVPLFILIAGLALVHLFNQTLNSPHGASPGADTLFIGFEFVTILLSLLILVLSFRLLFFYQNSLKMSQELWQLNQDLEKRVAERTTQLERANRQKSSFLSLVSHDLKTPLTAVMRFISILDRKEQQLTQDQKEIIGYVQEGLNQMRTMITQVLDKVRLDEGKLEISPCNFTAKDLMTQLNPMFEVLAAERDIRFIANIPHSLKMTTDFLLLKQILLNLFSNAVKYNRPKGSIWFSIKYNVATKRIFFVVKDTGIGIPSDKLPNLFTEYYRLHSTQEQVEGTGLGLSGTKKLAELLGGEASRRKALREKARSSR